MAILPSFYRSAVLSLLVLSFVAGAPQAFLSNAGLLRAGLSQVGAAEQEEPAIDFARQIRPILSDKCFHCHGPDDKSREAGLRLDTREGVFAKRENGQAVVPGDLKASLLVQRITSTDEFTQMPPPDSNRSLSAEQIELLKKWITSGANYEQHWAFEPPVRPALPTTQQSDWPINAIDAFVLARIEAADLKPSAVADKRTLIRRVSLDLTGLPPSPAEVTAFLEDDAPDAYEKLVDRLLASPHYGERMAWPWLDAARYADSSGYQGDPERTMWPWRDWVVASFNRDQPFDDFTVEQIAGDLLPDATTEQKLATGFNRNHMYNGEGGRIAEETRVENVMDRTETTATVFLGVTLGCARCHDHKYDPFTQQEYYEFYDFFNQTSEQGNGRGGAVAPNMKSPSHLETLEIAKLENEIQSLNAQLAGDGAADKEKLQQDLASAEGRLKSVRDKLAIVMVMDRQEKLRTTQILERGTYNKPKGDSLTSGVPSAFPGLVMPMTVVSEDGGKDGAGEGGRASRLDLANWLVDERQPLTARVTVNRIWQNFFGRGLVKTTEDFGSQGSLPTHPQLLDWLAVEFQESGWDTKHIHRLIVTSSTYRQSSKVTAELLDKDPENLLLARLPRYRMPSWMLRDQALAASGLLADSLGGESVKPYQPAGLWAEATFGKKRYDQDHGEALYRRSLYIFWRRIIGPTMFFDEAKRQTCEVKPLRTNTPLHALVTFNETAFVEATRVLAEKLMIERPDEVNAQITAAFERVLCRPPQPQELQILLARFEKLRSEYAANPADAEKLLAVGEWPRDKSLDVARHAALTGVCSVIFNLDETLSRQ